MTQYRCILTNKGLAKQAAAIASQTPLKITHMALGDGGGVEITPDPAQTALAGEQYRNQINRLFNPNISQVTVELIVPLAVGGWWVRELGVYDVDGDLIAVASVPPAFKPAPSNGAARALTVRASFAVSSATAFSGFIIDPGVGLVTVESLKAEIDKLMPLILAGL